jgi:hypothetical protein
VSAASPRWVKALSSRIACLEDQVNATGIVRDVGFIGPLTRCLSELTGMVATCADYRRGRRPVLVTLNIPGGG